jgi:hypothetical protein
MLFFKSFVMEIFYSSRCVSSWYPLTYRLDSFSSYMCAVHYPSSKLRSTLLNEVRLHMTRAALANKTFHVITRPEVFACFRCQVDTAGEGTSRSVNRAISQHFARRHIALALVGPGRLPAGALLLG